MAELDVSAAVRALFLDARDPFGCAETAFIVLKRAYDIDDPADASAAMALNGGVAYRGGPCGAITGAALAVGMLAGRRLADHQAAKRVARGLVGDLIGQFEATFGSSSCRDLIGFDLTAPGEHEAFMASGIWRDRCLRQIEFAVGRMAPLADDATWATVVHELEKAAVDPAETGRSQGSDGSAAR